MKTIIIAATHEQNRIPDSTGCLPVMAGTALFSGVIPDAYFRDDSGDNISEKNSAYSELTALYWAWKNLEADILGLCHYRRFFSSPEKKESYISAEEAEHLLNVFDAILPSPRHYMIETNYSQYAHSHHAEDLELTRNIISERHPDYLDAYDRRMAMTTGHRFNMFIMTRNLADEYCSWLFDILFELERRLDTSDYSGNYCRVFGHVSERLLDVWIDKNGLRAVELDYIFIGRERLAKKAAAMIGRKLKGLIRQNLIAN